MARKITNNTKTPTNMHKHPTNCKKSPRFAQKFAIRRKLLSESHQQIAPPQAASNQHLVACLLVYCCLWARWRAKMRQAQATSLGQGRLRQYSVVRSLGRGGSICPLRRPSSWAQMSESFSSLNSAASSCTRAQFWARASWLPGVLLPFSSPASINMPVTAPQVMRRRPMPPPNEAATLSSWSVSTSGKRSAKAATTDCAQLQPCIKYCSPALARASISIVCSIV